MLAYVARYFNAIAPLVRRQIRLRYGFDLAAHAYNGARAVYRRMLASFPPIGDANPMADNAYAALVFLSMYRNAEGELTPEMLRQVIADLFDNPPVKGALGLTADLNRPADVRRLAEQLRSHARWADGHPETLPYTWDFHFDADVGEPRVAYHFTHCPICDFCHEMDLIHVLPVLCEVDEIMCALSHGRLTRHQTLSTGGDVCDFLIEGDRQAEGQ